MERDGNQSVESQGQGAGVSTRRPKRVKLPRGRMAAISMGGQVGAARVVTIRGRAVVEFELPAGANVIAVPDDKHLTVRTFEK